MDTRKVNGSSGKILDSMHVSDFLNLAFIYQIHLSDSSDNKYGLIF